MKKNIAFIIWFSLSFGILAQENNSNLDVTHQEMVTDRPDATESPNTVPLKSFQIETGGLYVTNKNQGIETELIVINNTLVRYGILKNLELRLAWAISETRNGLANQD